MANFTGAARDYGTSFSIGHYGFIGCGYNGSTYYNDFYKWNQTTNAWSAIANYPGAGYYYSPVGFTVEGKGYVGLGYGSSGVNKDLWMYDTATNSWTQKASLPGSGRYDEAYFVMGHKLYVIGGSAGGSPYLNDVWVYDTHTNTWKQLNNFPSSEIDGGVGFAIGNYGYVGCGVNSTSTTAFWKYDTTNDSWTSIASYPYSGGVGGAHAFVIGRHAFICTGQHGGTYLNPVTIPVGYVYDTATKAWSEFTNMGANGNERAYSTAFTIGNNGYIGIGIDSTSTYQTSFWQYTDTSTTVVCSIHANFNYSQGTDGQVTFTSSSTGTSSGTSYAWDAGDSKGTGNGNVFNYTYTSNGTYSVKLSLKDNSGACTSDTLISITISNVVAPTCNLWTKMSNFTGAARDYGTSFSIGHYGFIGCGFNGSTYYNDFYKWNQTSNTWSSITSYPGAGYYYSPVGFTIEGKGYVGLGEGSSGAAQDLWMYDTATNSWSQKASLPGSGRYDAAWFVMGHKLYVIGGSTGGSPYLNDVWVYDAHTNVWKQLNNFPSSEIDGGAAFAIGNYGYVGCGTNDNSATAFWRYDTTKDNWTSIANFPYSGGVNGSRVFVLGSRAFVCNGHHGGTYLNPLTIPVGYVYDTISKAWSEFTNMGINGNERAYSTAFTIGNDGYIGTGIDSTSTYQTSFWQYYPCADTATAPVCKLHASFTSTFGSNGQVTFTNKSTGITAGTKYSWTAGDSAGKGSSSAFSYTYASNGTYTVTLNISDSLNICSSDTAVVITVNSIVAPTCNLWTKMSNFTGAARDYGTSFSIGHYGFIGCGFNGSTHYNDFYKWNQTTNTWSAIASYPGAGYYFSPIGFTIEGKGYVGLGGNTSNGGGSNDLWQYDTTTNSWTQKASLPGTARYDASWFVIGHKLYVIGGSAGGSPYLGDVWVYDAHTNAWKQLNNSPAPGIDGMAAFTIGNHGYLGGGGDGSGYTSFWQYDTTNDSWTPIANYPGYTGIGLDARAFVIGSKAYLCTGGDGGSYLNPIPTPVGYEYDTISKAWSEFTNMGANGIERAYSAAFTIGNYGYIGTGVDSVGTYQNTFWQYTPCDTVLPPTCTLVASFSSNAGSAGLVTFTSTTSGTNSGTKYAWDAGDGKGQGSGSTFAYTYLHNGTYLVKLVASDSNGSCASNATANVTVTNAAGCALHSDFSVLTGSNGQVACNSTSSGTGAGTQYYWNAGNNSGGGNGSSFLYTYAYNGTYGINLFVTDSTSSCSSDTTIYVTISNAAVCNLKADFTYTTGSNGQVNFNSTSTGMTGTSQLYWYTGDSIGYGYGNPYSYTYQKNGTYPVTLSLSNTTAGCTSDTTINVTISNATNAAGTCSLGITLQSAKASCDTCNDGGATVTATSGTGPYSYHWSNGATTTSIVAKPGIYTCCVTDAGGCSACANTTVTDSCLYAEFTYTVKNNTAGDSAVISFVSISDTVCHDSTHGPSKPLKSVSYTWNFGDGNSQTISGIGVRTSTHSFSTNGTYNITLAINREGSQVKSIAIKPLKLSTPTGPTGIRSLSNSADIKLFPNPNNGLFMLAIGGVADNQEATLQVSNLLGEVVYTSSAHSSNGTIRKEIDLTNVSAGTYFVRVVTATKVYVSKVLITR